MYFYRLLFSCVEARDFAIFWLWSYGSRDESVLFPFVLVEFKERKSCLVTSQQLIAFLFYFFVRFLF